MSERVSARVPGPSWALTTARSVMPTLALAAGMLATGCAADSVGREPGLLPAEPPMATIYEYTHTGDGYRLLPVQATVPERLEGQTAFTSDAMRAVAALLDHTPTTKGQYNLWNGDCAPGEEVTDVEISREQVTVRLTGWSGTICDIDQEALDARNQQIAWTIIVSSKTTLAGPPFPEIIVRDGSGETWDPITSDGSYLPPGDED